MAFSEPTQHLRPLSRKCVVAGLLSADARVLEEIAIGERQLFHECGLLVHGLHKAALVFTELLELRFEKGRIEGGFFVEYEDIGDVVVVDLLLSERFLHN